MESPHPILENILQRSLRCFVCNPNNLVCSFVLRGRRLDKCLNLKSFSVTKIIHIYGGVNSRRGTHLWWTFPPNYTTDDCVVCLWEWPYEAREGCTWATIWWTRFFLCCVNLDIQLAVSWQWNPPSVPYSSNILYKYWIIVFHPHTKCIGISLYKAKQKAFDRKE